VSAHGGTIDVESSPSGTAFRVTLPLDFKRSVA
jgi:signal transduction histidine kinase